MRCTTLAMGALGGILSLACGGAGTEPPVAQPAIGFAPQPDPDAPRFPIDNGLGQELSFPLAEGQPKRTDADAVEILHPSAWDAGLVWDRYRAHLEGEGWTWIATQQPPFEGEFERGDARVFLACEQAGSSVWVKARRR